MRAVLALLVVLALGRALVASDSTGPDPDSEVPAGLLELRRLDRVIAEVDAAIAAAKAIQAPLLTATENVIELRALEAIDAAAVQEPIPVSTEPDALAAWTLDLMDRRFRWHPLKPARPEQLAWERIRTDERNAWEQVAALEASRARLERLRTRLRRSLEPDATATPTTTP